MPMPALLKRPSAFLPIALSLVALAFLLVYFAAFGVVRQADEGAAAHIWQLLMAAQVALIAYFAIRWVPADPRRALQILGLQVLALLAAAAPVFLLRL